MLARAEPIRKAPERWAGPPVVRLPEQRLARLAVRRVGSALIHGKRVPFHPLLLHGPPGTGKTLLANRLHERVAAECSVTRLVAADWLPGEQDEVRGCDLLIIEDLQHLPARFADVVSDMLDYRWNRRLATVVTADRGPAGLQLPARFRNRLAGGLVVGLERFAVSSRRKLLRQLAQERDLEIEPDALAWLARNIPGSGRQLIAAVTNLETGADGRTGPLRLVDVDVAFHEDTESFRPSLDRITQLVGGRFQVRVKRILGPDRHPQTLWPRQLSMYLARRLTGLSLARIGEYFGRDHSTVSHACQKVSERLLQDTELPGLVREISAELEGR